MGGCFALACGRSFCTKQPSGIQDTKKSQHNKYTIHRQITQCIDILYYTAPLTESMMEEATSHSSRGITLHMLCIELRCGLFVHKFCICGDNSCWNPFSGYLTDSMLTAPLLKATFTWIICRFHPLTRQDYTFRDHFYSFQLERWVSKVFGLANHDDELWYFLLSVKQTLNNDLVHMFSVIDDCSMLPSGVMREEIWSEWFVLRIIWNVNCLFFLLCVHTQFYKQQLKMWHSSDCRVQR